MSAGYQQTIAEELKLDTRQVDAVTQLLASSATVPFIARYRKEMTGSLDEVAVAAIRDRITQLRELDDRRKAIVKSLSERDLLNPDLAAKIAQAPTLSTLEDIYLPYRPKRRTRAMIAREKGLEPIAKAISDCADNLEQLASAMIDPAKDLPDLDKVLAGARDIIAEQVNEDPHARQCIRKLFNDDAVIQSRLVKDKQAQGAKYRDYFDYNEPANRAPSHRVLAMFRAEKEGIISLNIEPDAEQATALLQQTVIDRDMPQTQARDQLQQAVADSYRRLMRLSLENELRREIKQNADEQAIAVFTENLRQLLMAPPLGRKPVIAIDPGFRTGCKLACLDAQGRLLHHDVIYLGQSTAAEAKAEQLLCELAGQYNIQAFAVGNGTGGREAEQFIRKLDLKTEAGRPIPVILVNESGASIYSASDVAREEFPDLDLTVRGAVSIGRRLMDPLAELVKIDPKSIGVGQYQHDVNQVRLKKALDDVVERCVNAVGVDINTASKQLLSYVSGLGPSLAHAVVQYRNEHGPFTNRRELKKVPHLGPKAFEQAAGFCRIPDATNPLDRSAVHPESYHIVEQMARDLDCSVNDLMIDPAQRTRIDKQKYLSPTVGLPTLNDILDELAKPGRDPRKTFEPVQFDQRINRPEDLAVGMKLTGVVTNVTNFGAFVDIGVHQDGLVHISQLADRYVNDPNTVVKVNQQVKVTVLALDLDRKRISLSMKTKPEPDSRCRSNQKTDPSADNNPNHRQPAKPRPSGGYQPFKDLDQLL